MRLILNEQDILKQILECQYIDKDKPTNTIKILIKYYLYEGIKKSNVIVLIDSFLKDNLPNYNSVKWQNTIENMTNKINREKNFDLLNITSIEITEKELNTIKDLNQEKYEKLAFVLLVYAKIYNLINNNEKNWVNEEHKYIFSDAKIAIKVNDQGKMINELYKMGLVKPSLIVDRTNIKVNFVDKESPVVLVITDFRSYIYEYLRWKGKNIDSCDECGILFIPSNNRQKYCKDCWKKVWKGYNAEKQREYRSRVCLENA